MATNIVKTAWDIAPSSDGKRWSAWPAGDKPSSDVYTTTFPTTQAPLNDAVITIGTQQDGSGTGGPDATGGSPGFIIAPTVDKDHFGFVVGRVSTTKHYSEVVIKRTGGATPDSHEVEVHVGGNVSPTSVTSYEVNLWGTNVTAQPVRWEDPLGGFNTGVFTTISNTFDGGTALVDGDVVRVEFDSTSGSPIITMKVNGITKAQWTDTSAGKILAGSPGFAMFRRTGTTAANYCIKTFSCGSF